MEKQSEVNTKAVSKGETKLQIKGKESENSYKELKRSQKGQAHTNTRKLN